MPLPDWARTPSGRRWYTWPAFMSELTVSLLSDGNDFVRCFPDSFGAQALQVLDPQTVQEEPNGLWRVAGAELLSDYELMHIPWVTLPGKRRGINVVEAAEDTTGLEIAARQWAGAFFANGGAIGGLISVPGGPETVNAQQLAEQWEARHTGSGNVWKPAVLTGGATFSSDTIAPKEADLDPLWRHVLEEAARLYHIPPHMLASQQPGGSSYSSVEQRSLEYIQHAIVPITVRLESALSLLVPGEDTYVKLNVNSLLRGDMTSRAQFYSTLLDAKVLRREEVREKEDMPYDGALGYLETPNNNGPRDAGEEPQRTFVINDLELREGAAEQIATSLAETVAEQGQRTEAALAQMHAAIQAAEKRRLAAEATTPTERLPLEREVIRDERGLVVGVVDRQGGETRRKIVERDSDGKVLRVKEVAA